MTFKIFQPEIHTSSTSGEMDMLRNLGENKHWPRLRPLEPQWPVRTAADLEAFLSPHIGHGLKTLILHGLCLVSGWKSMEAMFVERQEAPVIGESRMECLGTTPPSVSSRTLSGLFLWPSCNVGTELLRLAIGQGVVMGWRPNLGAGRLPKV